jgi:hypothetical protein
MKKILLGGVAATGLVSALAIAPAFAASDATWNQTVQVTSNSVITIASTAGSPVTIAADPTANGGFGTTAVPLTISTNNDSGFNLTLSMIAGDTKAGALYDTTGTETEEVAGATGTLVANQWGYNFVNSATNTVPTASTSFSKVPNLVADSGTGPVTLLTTGAEGTSNVFVNFAAVIDYTLPAATYSNQVTYTASVNP